VFSFIVYRRENWQCWKNCIWCTVWKSQLTSWSNEKSYRKTLQTRGINGATKPRYIIIIYMKQLIIKMSKNNSQ